MAISTTVHHDHDNFFRIVGESINGQNTVTFDYDNDGLLISAGASELAQNASLN